ncbi:MAG TPA: putative phage abortive infection protein [Dysgonomonas sp.]|uniref:putative phage abortive infection protein n=1 Tax=unclassified Dysgonomonas TaxID=2630389 RepID=UPI0025B87B0D|nr:MULTISPECIES: putative phage abortive infection protein [unclassified Dysgonomonas]HML66465.1 putative phage abortive infection protein [Dysgonomonas sp.]
MKKVLFIFSGLFTLIGLALLVWFVYIYMQSDDIFTFTKESLKGNAGEFIGGIVGMFFTITGSLLLFLTLNYQRDEFKETQLILVAQQFETTFFNMLSMLGEIRQSISGSFKSNQGKNDFHGQAFIHKFRLFLQDEYNDYIEKEGKPLDDRILEAEKEKSKNELNIRDITTELDVFYMKRYEIYQSQLGHYFRYIFNIIKHIEAQTNQKIDKRKYIDLLQAQLSNDELAIIFYNAISSNGINSKKVFQFKKWIEQYQFLENLDKNSLLDRKHHILYQFTKFKFLNRDELSSKKN